ncbi:MAG: hypothetical protein H8E55_17695 [Pelagibacterales bacterium]|nr:hypothetical protein [Pelagibacterales bacterium]
MNIEFDGIENFQNWNDIYNKLNNGSFLEKRLEHYAFANYYYLEWRKLTALRDLIINLQSNLYNNPDIDIFYPQLPYKVNNSNKKYLDCIDLTIELNEKYKNSSYFPFIYKIDTEQDDLYCFIGDGETTKIINPYYINQLALISLEKSINNFDFLFKDSHENHFLSKLRYNISTYYYSLYNKEKYNTKFDINLGNLDNSHIYYIKDLIEYFFIQEQNNFVDIKNDNFSKMIEENYILSEYYNNLKIIFSQKDKAITNDKDIKTLKLFYDNQLDKAIGKKDKDYDFSTISSFLILPEYILSESVKLNMKKSFSLSSDVINHFMYKYSGDFNNKWYFSNFPEYLLRISSIGIWNGARLPLWNEKIRSIEDAITVKEYIATIDLHKRFLFQIINQHNVNTNPQQHKSVPDTTI